ncbi:MAG: hypothetical protein AABW81_02550 [Nanoarchaeota archaeon]
MSNQFVYRLEELVPRKGIKDNFGFGMNLKKDFALRCKNRKLLSSEQQKFQDIIKNQISIPLRYDELNPLDFFEDSLLVISFYLHRGNGLWLSAERSSIENLDENSDNNLLYSSHNVDSTREAYSLISVFERWVHYTKAFLEE